MLDLFVDWRAWLIIILLALVTQIMSLAKYRLGQAGLDVVIERYPQIPGERWNKLGEYFQRYGSPIVFLSFLPVLALIIPPAAGAYGVKLAPFLIFSFLGKMVRYWILAIILFGGFQIVS
jgi:membrane protein YqaA with SNARE-associated domain